MVLLPVIIHEDEPNLYSSHRKPMSTINTEGRLTSSEWEVIHKCIDAEQILVVNDEENELFNTIRRKGKALEAEESALTALQELDDLDQNPPLEVV